MSESGLRFYPGSGNIPALPLARFLPPLPDGMIAGWLGDNVPPGSWLLDPLGSSPALVLEAARAGYRVIAACNNPILSFMIETLAAAPRSGEIQSALAELAVTKRGEERLEKHIQSLYLTECENCGEPTPAHAFLWRKGEPQPYARLYRCANCGEAPSGERPVTPADLARLQSMGGDRLQRARALQRVILNDEEHRADVEEALESYLPRPLYVLFTLLNKVEGLGLPPDRVRLLHALLISAFDAGSTLWPWPAGRSRPRQLTVPPQFRENNLWAALEEAAAAWVSGGPPIPVTRWPSLPEVGVQPSGAICLFRGRVKTLMPLPPDLQPRAVITAFPRPSQAFWTLSALWTGWLWGAEAALPLRNVLDRRRYDWNWHTSAMHSALAAVGWNLPAGTPFFGVVSDLAPGFLSAVVAACQAAGFDLEGLAMRGEQELAQGLWFPLGGPQPDASPPAEPQIDAKKLDETVRAALQSDLLARAEPAPYLVEYAAGLEALARAGAVPRSLSSIPGDLLTRIQAVLARTFADRSFLKLYGGPAEESGWWWLASGSAGAALPLADRIEIEAVRFMQRQPVFTLEELEQALCAQFTGLQAPSPELVRACLESYAERLAGPGGEPSEQWRMQAGETAAARRADLQEMQALLEKAGRSLGMRVVQDGPVSIWLDAAGEETWRFYRMASSLIARYVLAPPPRPPERMVLVLPGSRARLLALKLRRDPRLAEAASAWPILKFRHLREIASRADLTLELWESLLDDDPLTDDATQMRLFSAG